MRCGASRAHSSEISFVTTRTLEGTGLAELAGKSLPAVVTAPDGDDGLDRWFERNGHVVRDKLQGCGGILLRGFHLPDAVAFQTFARDHLQNLLPYSERSTPRHEVGDRVYTSTEYPSDQVIVLHNEFSYARRWPAKICFFCDIPAASGGQTPVADGAAVNDAIDLAVHERFVRHGVMYVRRYGWGVDLSWQEAFCTADKAAVEAHCRANDIAFEWRGDKLLTRQVRPATLVHPESGKTVWFNQANLFHTSNLPPATRSALRRILGENMPRDALFGDGSPISDEDIAEVARAVDSQTVCFQWQRGDVMLLDNMRVQHGRRAFSGDRRVLVAMAEMFAGGGAACAG